MQLLVFRASVLTVVWGCSGLPEGLVQAPARKQERVREHGLLLVVSVSQLFWGDRGLVDHVFVGRHPNDCALAPVYYREPHLHNIPVAVRLRSSKFELLSEAELWPQGGLSGVCGKDTTAAAFHEAILCKQCR